MKKLVFALSLSATTIALLGSQTLKAESLNQTGLDFLSAKLGGQAVCVKSATRSQAKTETSVQPQYEVVNATVNNTPCFAVVVATENGVSVMGYGDNAHITELPDALLDIVNHAATSRLAAGSNDTFTPVAPMLTTKWGQNEPFNLKAPTVDGEHGVAGCVAVAMAQVLNYWRSETPGYDSIEYVDDKTGASGAEVQVDFSQVHYDWSLMLDDYSDGYTDAQAQEVARLMYECGAASAASWQIKNTYSNGKLVSSTKATSAAPPYVALNRYYNFNCSFLSRIYTATPIFMEVVREELYAGRPVIYGGSSSTSAHAFVVDGLDAQGFGHINWGWSGEADGYYDLNVCMPSNATTSDEAYDSGQHLVYGIRPRQNDESYKPAYVQTGFMPHPEVTPYMGTYGVTTNFYSPNIGYVGTPSTEAKFYGFCWVDCNTGEIATKGEYWYNYNTNRYSYFPNYSGVTYFSASGGRYDGVWLPSDIADGEYYFTTCYTNEDGTEYYPCEVLMANASTATVKNGDISYNSLYGVTGKMIFRNITFHNATAKSLIFLDLDYYEDSYNVDAQSPTITFTLTDVNSGKTYTSRLSAPSAYACTAQSLRFALEFVNDNSIRIPEGTYQLGISTNSNIECVYDEVIVEIAPQLDYPLMVSSATEWAAELSQMGAVALWNGAGGYCKPQDSSLSVFNRWYSCNKVTTPIDVNFYAVSVESGKEHYLTTYRGYQPKEYNPKNWIYPEGNLYPLLGDYYLVARYMTPDGEKPCSEPWYNPFTPGALFSVSASATTVFQNLVISSIDRNVAVDDPQLTVSVANHGTTDFAGVLYLTLRNLTDGRIIEVASNAVEIAQGKSALVTFAIDGLNVDDQFAASIKSVAGTSRSSSSPTAVLDEIGDPAAFMLTATDGAGIGSIICNEEAPEVARYNLLGTRLSKPTSGINIILYKNGTVRKVMVK